MSVVFPDDAAEQSAAVNEAAVLAATAGPYVASANPADGATGILLDTFISCNLSVRSGGIDTTTLNNGTVRLYRTSDGGQILASLNTSAGGDVLALSPSAPLDPDTNYTFEVNAGLKDVSGDSFAPFVIHFTTGKNTSAVDSSLRFVKVSLDTPAAPYTAVTRGPDGRLYAATETGEIIRFDIRPDGTLTNAQVINSLIQANGGEARMLIGIQFDPLSTANDMVLWATHSAYAIDNGPDWTGKVTRLSGPDLATVQDYVVGLPRSTRDHVTNQLTFGPDGAIYFPQASNTAMGAPDYAWHFRPERYLSAAILRLDVSLVRDRLANGEGPIDVRTEEGGSYNPFAAGAPLTIYASGVRNAYDLLWHSNGSLYAPTNGSQLGGATPAGTDGTPGIDFVDQVEDDFLFKIDPGGYYGHPNPARAQYVLDGGNPTASADPYEIPQYPLGTMPDGNWRQPAFDFGQHYSPNGIIEYRGMAFGGILDHKILVTRYSGGDDIVVLSASADGRITGVQSNIEGLENFNDPVDLAEDPSSGFVYVAEFGGQRITLVKPADAGLPPVVSSPPPSPPPRVPLGPYGLSANPSGKDHVGLSWIDTVGEAEYRIERSSDGKSGWTPVGTTSTNETAFTDTGLARGATYSYRVRAINSIGASKATPLAAATTLAIVLPTGWTGGDVGDVGAHGTADYFEDTGTFVITGAGADIDGPADAMFFAGTGITGDVEIVARVSGIDPTNPLAKAGIMLRTSATDPAAADAFMTLTSAAGPQFQERTEPGGDTQRVQDANLASTNAPYWVRLVRRGEMVSGYVSPDGATWTRIALVRVALGEQLVAGLAVSSHDPAALCNATFDNVRVNAAPPLILPEAPSDLSAAVAGTRVALTWRDNALDDTGYEIERRKAGSNAAWVCVADIGADATSYEDVHLAGSKKYEYRVHALNPAGDSDSSNESMVKTGKPPKGGQTPFMGAPAQLPGQVEVEQFDDGAKGRSWKDRTPENDLGALRDAGADIEPTTDPDGGGFQVVASKGEWLEYTVDAPIAGQYTLDLRYAAADGFGGTVAIESDAGRSITNEGAIALPSTGGWSTWQTATGTINLKAGIQVIRLCTETSNSPDYQVAALNWFRMTPAPQQPETAPNLPAPTKTKHHKQRAANLYASLEASAA